MDPGYFCRICGYNCNYPWWDDLGYPSDDICPCCGAEAGYQDCCYEAVKSYRKEWLDKGGEWKWTEEKPPNWSREDLMKQLKQIPEEFQ